MNNNLLLAFEKAVELHKQNPSFTGNVHVDYEDAYGCEFICDGFEVVMNTEQDVDELSAIRFARFRVALDSHKEITKFLVFRPKIGSLFVCATSDLNPNSKNLKFENTGELTLKVCSSPVDDFVILKQRLAQGGEKFILSSSLNEFVFSEAGLIKQYTPLAESDERWGEF